MSNPPEPPKPRQLAVAGSHPKAPPQPTPPPSSAGLHLELSKVLELERAKGFTNQAVIGGLDGFLRRLQDRAAGTPLPPLPKPSYTALSPEQRQRWAERAQRWLKTRREELAQPSTKPAKERPATAARATRAREAAAPTLQSPVTALGGVSGALAIKLRRLGVSTIGDLFYLFPRHHNDYSQITPIAQLRPEETQTIVAAVWQAQAITMGRLPATEAVVGDDTGNLRVIWFRQPYLAPQFRPGAQLVLSGRVGLYRHRLEMQNPDWELLDTAQVGVEPERPVHAGRLVPVYPLTEGLPPRTLRRLVKAALDGFLEQVGDFMPAPLRSRQRLLPLPQALKQAHFPDSNELLTLARQRLAFDELFLIQLRVLQWRHDWQAGQAGCPIPPSPEVLEAFLDSLPFSPTRAQRRVLDEIVADMAWPRPMRRLLEGEVGSGKTVVATAALLSAVAAGYQGAFMAPTEILAEQHFASLKGLLGAGDEAVATLPYLPRPVRLARLTGSTRHKEALYQALAQGEIDLVVGTHALIQEGVEFARLGLAVVDEQHRFGVEQRAALRQKGQHPHLLVMTATPIPRTLALTLYGDLDLSVIDEMPPGRQEIKTRYLQPQQRGAAYRFVHDQVADGRQAFVICPLVEESERLEVRAAVVEYERLQREVFPDLRLGLLHGRMSSTEKDEVMRAFRAGKLDILVATPVVEVGVDVPNATVMLVEGADRFGLSQLHQFRGRVGRGQHQSYCLLLAESPSQEARERLKIIESTQDGFALAEEDLRLRGPGEFFGTRQSGLPELRVARLSDRALIELARDEANRLLLEDPNLEKDEHRALAQRLTLMPRLGGDLS